jgi:NADH-quinone oxidoreductase subunit N
MRLATDSNAITGGIVVALSALAVLSMLAGNLLALLQDNLKRLLAYSSIAHMGYLMIALIGVVYLPDTPFVVEAAMIYLAGYTLTTLVAFGVIATLSSAEVGDDAQTSAQYHGLFWHRPIAATCLTISLLSLMGMPLTAGFIAKFYVVAAGVQGDMWPLLWALIVGSAVSVYYYVKVIYLMTLTESPEHYEFPTNTAVGGTTVAVLGVAILLMGIYPTPLIEMIHLLIGDFGL